MPPLFTATLAGHLNQQSQLNVVEAADGMSIRGGNVFVAPGGKQMRVGGYPGAWTIEVNDDAPVGNCKPSVDYLFKSAAQQYGRRLLGIVMTGMGDDGRDGAAAISQRGGTIWAQDSASCAVYGMPRAVVEAGLADDVRSLSLLTEGVNQIAEKTATLVGSRK